MLIIIFILIIVILILLGFFVYQRINENKPSTYSSEFKNSLHEISKKWELAAEDKKRQAEQEIQGYIDNLNRQKDFLVEDLKRKKEENDRSLSFLTQEFEKAKTLLQEQNTKDIAHTTNEHKIELLQLKEEYDFKMKEVERDYNLQKELFKKKMENLVKEVEEYEDKQRKIIEQFKKDEETRQQKDFYKITIDSTAHADICKLKSIAEQLTKPIVLYKLIYENYYKVKLEEMFKRVLGENSKKGGIYKITNINNQKIYIGRTTEFLSRWRTHSKRGVRAEEGTSNKLYQFMWEEGLENFTFEIVEVCDKSVQPEREKYWIKFYHSDEYGYNSNKGG